MLLINPERYSFYSYLSDVCPQKQGCFHRLYPTLPQSLSLFVMSVSRLGSLPDFYRRPVAISDSCCHSTICLHWHLTPSPPCIIPGQLEAKLRGRVRGNWAKKSPDFQIVYPVTFVITQPNAFHFSCDHRGESIIEIMDGDYVGTHNKNTKRFSFKGILTRV